MAPDQLDQRGQRRRAAADPIGHRRDVEIDALAGKAFALAVEWLMMAVLGRLCVYCVSQITTTRERQTISSITSVILILL
jgi:hypothetical protein